MSPEDADALEARLRGINSMAQIVRAQRAAVGVDYVLGVGGFDLDRVEGEVRNHWSSNESQEAGFEALLLVFVQLRSQASA